MIIYTMIIYTMINILSGDCITKQFGTIIIAWSVYMYSAANIGWWVPISLYHIYHQVSPSSREDREFEPLSERQVVLI